MSAIYLHIPFCKQACVYCDFYFSTRLEHIERFMSALKASISWHRKLLDSEVTSVYFGGGTPSILELKHVEALLNEIDKHYHLSDDLEVTFELNPDDASLDYLKGLFDAGVNRLSIGIQSFLDHDLSFMKRAHNAEQAKKCLTYAQQAGFENYSIDLIYGLQNDSLKENIDIALDYAPKHISAYHLTVEPKTELDYLVKQKKISFNEAKGVDDYWLLCQALSDAGYEHYEVSNFAQPDFIARHNSKYWKGEDYIGLGPSAHSYLKGQRSMKTANINLYCKHIEQGVFDQNQVIEQSSLYDQYNDFLITRLRAKWGIQFNELLAEFPDQYTYFMAQLKHVDAAFLQLNKKHVKLTEKGMLFSDQVFLQLILTSD